MKGEHPTPDVNQPTSNYREGAHNAGRGSKRKNHAMDHNRLVARTPLQFANTNNSHRLTRALGLGTSPSQEFPRIPQPHPSIGAAGFNLSNSIMALALFLGASLLLFVLTRRARTSGQPKTPAGIEGLECRIAPAALTAKFSAGLLTISGDPAAANIEIVETAGSFEVFDGAASLGQFSGVKNITATIQGNASVNANLADGGIAGSLKVSINGTGTLTLFSNSHVDGALVFKGNDAAQLLTLGTNVVVGKNLTFNGQSGEDSFTIGGGTTIRGNATFTAIEFGAFTNISVITIEGSLRFKNAANSVDSTFRREGGTEPVNIGGALSYVGGPGDDSLSLGSTIGGDVTFIDSAGNNTFNVAADSIIHGKVTMKTGVGNDRFNIQSGSVDEDVTLKLGDGNNDFFYGIAGGVTIGGSLTFTTGHGADLWQGSGGGMSIANNLTINLGDGLNTIAASSNVGGNRVTVNTGDGSDTVSLDGGAPNAIIKVSLGGGNDSLAGTILRDPISATYDGGDGTDRFFENMLSADPLIIIGFEDFT